MKKQWQDLEYRAAKSKAARAAWARGTFDTEEWRRKKSEATKAAWARGVFDTEEWRQKMAEATKKRWVSGNLGNEEHRRGLSEAMKRRWKDGVYGDEQWRRKMSQAMVMRWRRGDFDAVFDEEYRRKQSRITKAGWANGVYDGVFQSPTAIELQIAAALDIVGIEHTSQYRPDGYGCVYDEFIPPNTLIEVHGDYWHGDDFPEQQQRDAEKKQWAEENGFRLVTIWEYEIKERGAWSLVLERV